SQATNVGSIPITRSIFFALLLGRRTHSRTWVGRKPSMVCAQTRTSRCPNLLPADSSIPITRSIFFALLLGRRTHSRTWVGRKPSMVCAQTRTSRCPNLLPADSSIPITRSISFALLLGRRTHCRTWVGRKPSVVWYAGSLASRAEPASQPLDESAACGGALCARRQPVLEMHRPDARARPRYETLIVELGAEVSCMSVRKHFPLVPVRAQHAADQVVDPILIGATHFDRAVQRGAQRDVCERGNDVQ